MKKEGTTRILRKLWHCLRFIDNSTVHPLKNFVIMSKRSQGLHLKIGEVPKHPYVNQPFEVVIHLVDDNGQLKCGYVPIGCNLHLYCLLFSNLLISDIEEMRFRLT
jgi:hypothetical protein